MRRLWFSLALLALLALMGRWHEGRLSTLCDSLTHLLEQSSAAAEAGDWQRGEALCRQAEELWQRQTPSMHMALRHDVIHDVSDLLSEAHALAHWRQGAEFAAVCARAVTALQVLAQSERLSLGNLL